jgi:hypothetical protein
MGALRSAPSVHHSAEFISLSSAALIAYYNIAGNHQPSATLEFAQRLDAVASAIASLVPVYTLDEEGSPLRPLTTLELALAEFTGGATQLVHRDRDLIHSDLRINRGDLLYAIHAMQDLYRPR